MGLDMYLLKRNKNSRDCDDFVEVGYWRKANHIHNWFVCNVQGGIDDCCIHRAITKEELEELHKYCLCILSTKDANGDFDIEIAEKLLPTCNGFFFGSDNYDEYYLESLEYTEETLSSILESTNFEEDNIYYLSSW